MQQGSQAQAVLSCQEEHVVLQTCSFTGVQWLLSLVSEEKDALPGQHEWDLDFEGGLGYVSCEADTLWVNQLFQRPVYKRGNDWFWQEQGPGGETILIDAASHRRSAYQIKCATGENVALRQRSSGWKTRMPAHGCKYWHRVSELSRQLGLESPATNHGLPPIATVGPSGSVHSLRCCFPHA